MKQKQTPQKQSLGTLERRSEGIYLYSPGGTFYAMFNWRGKRIKQRLGSTEFPCNSLPEAKRLLLELKSDLEKTSVTSTKKTLSQIKRAFLASLSCAPSTRAYKESVLGEFVSFFPASKRPSEVRKSEVLAFLKPYADKSASTHNHAMTAVRDLFAFAMDDLATASDPCSGIKYMRDKAEIKRLTPTLGEFTRIVESIRAVPTSDTAAASGDLVEFMGLAGLGQAECDGIRWGDINFESRLITIIRKKTGQQFKIPIYPPLAPLLTRMDAERIEPKASTDKVFSVRNPKKALESACSRLGIPDYTPRAFRRMFITRALELGIDPQTIAEWQGHSDGGQLILKVYGRVSKAHQMRMADRFAENIITLPLELQATGN
jgi:hypothetical protein